MYRNPYSKLWMSYHPPVAICQPSSAQQEYFQVGLSEVILVLMAPVNSFPTHWSNN